MGVSSSVLMGVKNNYYKAIFSNEGSSNPIKNKTSVNKSIKAKLFLIITETLSIEGFVLITVLVRFIDKEFLAIILLLIYLNNQLIYIIYIYIRIFYILVINYSCGELYRFLNKLIDRFT